MTRVAILRLWMVLVAAVVVVVSGALVSAAKQAQAAFPGKNGKIAFTTDRGGQLDIYTMTP
jgi:hypothetical protein